MVTPVSPPYRRDGSTKSYNDQGFDEANPTSSPSESIHGVDPRDHVATALRDLVAGETLDLHGQAITARADIPKGHKIAVRAVARATTC
jgi:hypothetical protein